MSTTLNIAELLPGREYDIDSYGIMSALTRKYQVLRNPGQSIEDLEIKTISGLPAIGDEHPNQTGLYVQSYHVSEQSDQRRWVIDVRYATTTISRKWWNSPPVAQAEQSRGWDAQDINVDLTHDAVSGAANVNAAGDPFESVPQVARNCPVFRLVRKENTTLASRLALSGTVNSVAGTIDGVAIGIHCGRLTVGYRKLYNDPGLYAYEYTYSVAKMSNIVKISGTATDIGWDHGMIERGLFYLDADGKKVRAMELDAETKKARPRATPVLLNADGTLNTTGVPVVTRIASHPEAEWGTIFV